MPSQVRHPEQPEQRLEWAPGLAPLDLANAQGRPGAYAYLPPRPPPMREERFVRTEEANSAILAISRQFRDNVAFMLGQATQLADVKVQVEAELNRHIAAIMHLCHDADTKKNFGQLQGWSEKKDNDDALRDRTVTTSSTASRPTRPPSSSSTHPCRPCGMIQSMRRRTLWGESAS